MPPSKSDDDADNIVGRAVEKNGDDDNDDDNRDVINQWQCSTSVVPSSCTTMDARATLENNNRACVCQKQKRNNNNNCNDNNATTLRAE